MSETARVFYPSFRNPLGAAIIACYLTLAAIAWPHFALMALLVVKGVFVALFIAMACTVSVTQRGITLYRLNKAQWSDIKSVKPTTFFGLPYLLLYRNKGWKWWLPLYLQDTSAFRAAIIESAPAGNPLRTYAESRSNI